MKRLKKSLVLLLALAMCLSVLSIGSFAVGEDLFDDVEGKLVIIHTNDVHGRDVTNASQYGTAAVSQLKKDFEAAGANVLLLSAGDAIQGLPLVNYDFGATAINFLAAAGYDAMSPGNHEFDWGVQNLFDILEDSGLLVISANIVYLEDNPYGGTAGELVFPGNEIFDLDGLKVGVFGLTTPEASTKAHPDKVSGVEFLQGEELFAAAQAQVDFLVGEGCDLIICLGHLGIDDESTGNRSIDVIEAVDGIDIFVDGHSHTELANGREVGDTLLVSAGTALAKIGVVVVDPAEGTIEASLLGIVSGEKDYAGIDEDLKALIDERNEFVTTTLVSEKIGITDVLLYGANTTDPPGVRVAETNLGDFATDALLWAANIVYGAGFADAALTNGGGIRASIPVAADAEFPYEITMMDMVTVFPFGNQVEIVEITGAQLLEALEAATFSNPAAVGAFPQVSGIQFTLNNAVPFERGEQYPGSTYYPPAVPGSRVRDVMVGGAPLELDRVYRIATNDFTAAGGDTYRVFRDKITSYSTGIAMEQALIDFLDVELDGVIGAEYAAPQGRIIIDAPSTWAVEKVVEAIEAGVVPYSVMYGGWIGDTTRLAAAEATVLLIELLFDMTMEEIAEAEGWDLDDNQFDDTDSAAVTFLRYAGVVQGDGAGLYDPDGEYIRAHVVTMLGTAIEVFFPEIFSEGENPFTDVPEYAVKYVGFVAELGIVQGVGDGLFDSDTAMSNEQIAVLNFNSFDTLLALVNAE